MDNKEEKTFADIFSSTTTEDNDNQTFSNILKNENTQIEDKKVPNNTSVTFDNLFENLSSNETIKSQQSSNLFDEAVAETSQEESPSPSKEELLAKDKNTINSIFEPEVNSKELSSTGFDLFSNPKEEPKNKSLDPKLENPWFSERKEESKQNSIPQENENSTLKSDEKILDSSVLKKETSDDNSTIKIENNPFFNLDKELDSKPEIENPFFKTEIQSSEDSTKNIKEPVFFKDNSDTEVTKNVNENNSLHEESQTKIDKAENPFFATENLTDPASSIEIPNEIPTSTKKEKMKLEPSLESKETSQMKSTSPFFEEEIKENTENPFFTTKNLVSPSPSIEITNENSTNQEEIKLATPSESKEPSQMKSTSPFFEEEIKENTENPFFQNQINLVENKQPDRPKSNIDITKSKHYNVKIVKKKEPFIKFILGVISYAIFIFLLLIGITLLIYVLDIKIRAAKGDYSSPTFNAYVVLTGSMLPDIQVYDVVITKKVEASKLNEKDIITFASADSRFLGTIITHRIIKKNYDAESGQYTFQTKGDNNNVADSALVPEKNIYGKVILKIPKLGYLQEFLASDGGWIIVILIPCLTVISYDIVKLAKGLKRKKYKNIKVQK